MGARGGAPNSSPLTHISLFLFAVKGKTLYMIMRSLEQARHAMSNCRLRMRVATLIYREVLWRVSLCFVLVTLTERQVFVLH
jgi:hypothetical protein